MIDPRNWVAFFRMGWDMAVCSRYSMRFLHCCAGIVLACAMLSPLSAKEAKMDTLSIPPFFVGKSEDTHPVELQIAGHKMSIPRNYIGSAWFSDDRLALQLFTMYPDFGGVTLENFQTMRFGVGAATPDVIQITRYDEFDQKDAFRRSLSKAAREFGVETDLDGLVAVKEGFYNAQGFINNGLSFFVHKEQDATDDIIIQCTENAGNLHNCMIDVKFFDGVSFQYEFFFSHLKDWRNIHANVTNMLRTFLRV